MRVRLCVVFLDKGMPLPAKHALIRTRTATLSVTLLTAWATSQYQTALAIQVLEFPFVLYIGLREVFMQDFDHTITNEKQNYRNRQTRHD